MNKYKLFMIIVMKVCYFGIIKNNTYTHIFFLFFFLPFWACVYKYQIELYKVEAIGSHWMKESEANMEKNSID